MHNHLKASLLALCAMLYFTSPMALAALVEIPALTTRVTDLTATLSAQEQSQLEAKLSAFEQQKGSQIAVLIVPTTKPEEIEQYSIRVVEKWQIGREKADDGVLVLLAKDDRKMRIEVGYGLEGAIPDLYAKRIISEVIAPKFKQGDFSGGINDGVDKLIGLVNGEALPPPAKKTTFYGNSIENILPILMFGGLISGLFLRSILGTFLGSAANGGLIGGVVFLLGLSILGAGVLAVLAFVITIMLGSRGVNGFPIGYGGGYGGGGYGGGSSSWGGGGGGGFGGGGASGDW